MTPTEHLRKEAKRLRVRVPILLKYRKRARCRLWYALDCPPTHEQKPLEVTYRIVGVREFQRKLRKQERALKKVRA
jgi:hypothetical protein